MIDFIMKNDGSLGGIYSQSLFRTEELDKYIEERMRESGLND
jgi:hypothetical protein